MCRVIGVMRHIDDDRQASYRCVVEMRDIDDDRQG